VQGAGCLQKAVTAYEKAAHANIRGHGTAWHAAKHLEAAAQLSKEQSDFRACADYIRRAAGHFVECGKVGTGAECLGRGARWLEQSQPEVSCKLYAESLELYSKDPMASMAQDLVGRGVAMNIQASKWEDAAQMLMQWASICVDNKSIPYLCRAYLGAQRLVQRGPSYLLQNGGLAIFMQRLKLAILNRAAQLIVCMCGHECAGLGACTNAPVRMQESS
jgi:Soluble NSF attachment protein, SNAP